MKTTNPEKHFLEFFEQFISDSKNGKRHLKDGKKISQGTIRNYKSVYNLIKDFEEQRELCLRVRIIKRYSKTVYQHELRYWSTFCKKFTHFLYNHKGHHDNYIGFCFKIIKALFNYLKIEKGIYVGEIPKQFYTPREERPIIVLSPERLNFLIYNKDFEEQLLPSLIRTKDILVLGCIVGLRYSDLRQIKKENLRKYKDKTYLVVVSQKTKIETKVLLPDFALNIIHRYQFYEKRTKLLLPFISLSNFNKALKSLCKKAGWNEKIQYQRAKNGHYKKTEKMFLPFHQIVSSHIMRRTSITTLLMMGMPELLVRKISGHSSNSSSFFRYVNFVQSYQDEQIENAFNKLKLMNEASDLPIRK